MNVEQIVNLRLAHPFRPFRLIMVNGVEYPVEKPYYLSISQDRRAIGYVKADDDFVYFAPEHVREVLVGDTSESEAPRPGGGT